MKKLSLFLITTSISLMGIEPSELCQTTLLPHDSNACCGPYRPQQNNQNPFYQPSAILAPQNDEQYLPQHSSTTINQPIIENITPPRHRTNRQYNPADPLFEALRNCWASRRVIPAPPTESTNASIEQESMQPAPSCISSIINYISRRTSLNMCRFF